MKPGDHHGTSIVPYRRNPAQKALLRDADTIVVYEGLPYPLFEENAREDERLSKKVFPVSGELFYERALDVSDDDKRALDHLFRTMSICVSFRGEKFCGGFHADYMIEWKTQEEQVAVALLCFGCRELIVIAGANSERTDMSKPAFEALHPILKKYRQERPRFGVKTRHPLKPEVIPLPPPKFDVQM